MRNLLSLVERDRLVGYVMVRVRQACQIGPSAVDLCQVLQLSLLILLVIFLQRAKLVQLDVIWVALNELGPRGMSWRWHCHSRNAAKLVLVFIRLNKV